MYDVRELGNLRLELFTGLKSVAFSDFCYSANTIEFTARNGFLKNDMTLFKLVFPKYELEAKIRDGMVFIRRNEQYQHSEQYVGNENCHVAIQWDQTMIGCGVVAVGDNDTMDGHMRCVQTPFTASPVELVHILRKENLLENSNYRTHEEFFTTIIDCFRLCELDIRRHGGESFIWGKGGDVNKPLDEPDISRYVAGYLSSHGEARNFDVVCESIAGTGKIDFYAVAPVAGKNLAKIAIEAKKATHPKIQHGLEVQLPEYMSRISTHYGIFLTYWLRSSRYPHPDQETYPQFEVEMLHPISRPPTVRTISLDLSFGPTPSKA